MGPELVREEKRVRTEPESLVFRGASETQRTRPEGGCREVTGKSSPEGAVDSSQHRGEAAKTPAGTVLGIAL